jgi:hypothetical protein
MKSNKILHRKKRGIKVISIAVPFKGRSIQKSFFIFESASSRINLGTLSNARKGRGRSEKIIRLIQY